jgi:hypothetical protein
MNQLFQTRPVTVTQGPLAIGIGVAGFAIIEIEQALHPRRGMVGGLTHLFERADGLGYRGAGCAALALRR